MGRADPAVGAGSRPGPDALAAAVTRLHQAIPTTILQTVRPRVTDLWAMADDVRRQCGRLARGEPMAHDWPPGSDGPADGPLGQDELLGPDEWVCELRRLCALSWLLMMLPGMPGHLRNPPGTLRRQADRLLALLG